MIPNQKSLTLKERQNAIIILISVGIFACFFLCLELKTQKAEAYLADFSTEESLVFLQENALVGISDPSNPEPKVVKKIKGLITAYSSTPWETDDTPFLTAAGTQVRDGIVANNLLPFGTKIRIPEIYGEKVFVVEDRMNWKKGKYYFDIWFPSYSEALNFGAKRAYIEILEN